MEELKKLLEKTHDLSVLFVDDEKDVADAFQTFYKKFFSNVYIANDGIEGLELFKKHFNEIDVLITDIVMPRSDGIELINEIKKLRPDICVIVVTAIVDSDNLEGLSSLYLKKPLIFEDMELILSTIIQHKAKEHHITY